MVYTSIDFVIRMIKATESESWRLWSPPYSEGISDQLMGMTEPQLSEYFRARKMPRVKARDR